MPPLRHVGTGPNQDKEVATQSYVNSVRGSGSLTQSQINAQISTGLAPYADKSYVDSRDALNATKAQVDAGDAPKLKVATVNVNNGVAGLDGSGRVQVNRVPGTSTQRWPKGFYTPAAYNPGGPTAAEGAFIIHNVADPGFSYRLLISGQFDTRTTATGNVPQILVRIGSAVGPVVAYGNASPSQYRYGVDTFDRIAPSLGAGWEQVYTGPGSGHAETTTKAFWISDGNSGDRQGVFRKIADYATTVDDYQEVYYRVADTIEAGGIIGSPPRNRLYGRMNVARTNYVAFDMTDTQASLIYSTAGNENTLVAPVTGFAQNVGDEIVAQFGYYAASNKRRFRLIRNGVVKIDYTDAGNVTSMSTDHRGWGFGMRGGASLLFGQPKPAALEYIALNDPVAPWSADPENYSAAVLTSVDFANQPVLVGAQALYITIRSNSTAPVYTTGFAKLHVMAIPA